MKLTENEIRYGIDHLINCDPDERSVVEVAQYQGEKKLSINCTQLGDSFTPQFSSVKEKKRILGEWCDFLKANPTRFTSLSFGTRMPQELFDAACCQRKLVRLHIKWGVYRDLSAIENLQDLRVLRIGSGAGVVSILPLVKLQKLLALSVENFQKITDYAPLAKLENLQSLTIEGNGPGGPTFIKPRSLAFLRKMPQLRVFDLLVARLESGDYRPVLDLRKLEHLTLPPCREVEALYDQLCSLPKLTWGLLKESPESFAPKKRGARA